MIFENQEKPYFMTIPWSLAEIGNTLRLSKEKYICKKNVKNIVMMAKVEGVILEKYYASEDEDIVFIVIDINKNRNNIPASDIKRLFDKIKENPNISLQQIIKNGGWFGTHAKLRACLKSMVKDGIIYEFPYTHPNGGRPSTRYRARPDYK